MSKFWLSSSFRLLRFAANTPIDRSAPRGAKDPRFWYDDVTNKIPIINTLHIYNLKRRRCVMMMAGRNHESNGRQRLVQDDDDLRRKT